MRIRAVALVTALVAVGTLVVGASGAEAKSAPKAVSCAGKTKATAIKQIKVAYDYFLDGLKMYPADLKKSYVQGLDDPALSALFDKTNAANAASSATTNVKVNSVTCKAKDKADVKADLIVSGKVLPGIFPNPGSAIIVKGQWDVTKQTYCDLTALADSTVTQAGQPCAP